MFQDLELFPGQSAGNELYRSSNLVEKQAMRNVQTGKLYVRPVEGHLMYWLWPTILHNTMEPKGFPCHTIPLHSHALLPVSPGCQVCL